MRRFILHVIRVVGLIVIFFPAITAALAVAVVDRNFPKAGVAALIAAAAFGTALYADRQLRVLRARQEKHFAKVAAQWSGNQLIAGLRWFRWSWVTTLAVLFLLGGILIVQKPGLDAKPLLIGIGLLVLGTSATLVLLRLGWGAMRAGYVLRLGPEGVHHCLWPEIAWRDVGGVHVKTELPSYRGAELTPQHFLVLALSCAAADALRRSLASRLLNVLSGNIVERQLRIPCVLIKTSPELLFGAARSLLRRDSGFELD